MQCNIMQRSAVTAPRVGPTRVRLVVKAEGRFASYTGKGRSTAAPARGSYGGSSGGSSAKLSATDLAILRIDDLRELCGKTGTQLPREPTKDGLIGALAAQGVTLSLLSRGQMVDLCTKLGAPLAKDVEGLRRSLSSVVGKGSSSYSSSSSSSSSWRSAPAPAAASSGGRFSSHSAGATQKASWRRSGSYSAPASSGGGAGKLSSTELNHLRIDDLSELASKTGAANTRHAGNKSDLIQALVTKGVSVTDLTRGMLVDLCTKLGAPLAKDLEGLRRSVSGSLGKGGSYSSYSSASASSSRGSSASWRSSPAPAAAAPSGGRFSSYSAGSSNGSGSRFGGASAGGNDAVFEADLAGFKIDELSNMARRADLSLRNATKDSLARELAGKLKVSDLTKGQLVEILSKVGQPITGSIEDLRSRVRAAASARQNARVMAGSRW